MAKKLTRKQKLVMEVSKNKAVKGIKKGIMPGDEEDNDSPISRDNKLDPRQKLAWHNYIDQKSDTFSNGYASAIKAGYSHYFAKTVTTRPWWLDRKSRSHLLSKAEKVINKIFDVDTLDDKGIVKADLLRVQGDMAKHVTKTLGKDDGWSERVEGEATGQTVVFLPAELMQRFNLKEDNKE